MQTTEQQSFTPRTVAVMGAGEEISNIETLKRFHTPTEKDKGSYDYHSHKNLTSHYVFAKTILSVCEENKIEIDDIAFKVDKVEDQEIETFNMFGFRQLQKVTVAKRFFFIARIKNQEYQLADDVETFIIARNSHDKRVPMEVAIGNKVVICSNMMFGGDITIKAKNSRFGYNNLVERLKELFDDYINSAEQLKADIQWFKVATISDTAGLAFIAHNASSGEFVQPSRIPAVCDMFIKPEHAEQYKDSDGNEEYTLWRLLNAYTYVHRGELVINPDTNEPYADQRRTQVCPLTLKKEFTRNLWNKFRKVEPYGNWYKKS